MARVKLCVVLVPCDKWYLRADKRNELLTRNDAYDHYLGGAHAYENVSVPNERFELEC